jgi:AraC-like DNA-binding protein
MRNLLLIVSLLSASLLSDARIVVPDSMLTIEHAYRTAKTDTSMAIVQTMRERHLAPEWLLDMTEGDYFYATLDYTKATKLYERAYADKDSRSNPETEMELLKRLVHTHDIMYNEDELVKYIHELRQKAIRHKNEAYLSTADFVYGKRTHYHRQKEKGYEIYLKAVEMMKNSDYFRKYNELCNDYADLLLMYQEDGRYNDALRMSLLQEEAILHINGIDDGNKETMRFVYGLRASLLAKAGRQEEADQAYAEWKKAPNGNNVIDKAVLNYLIINKYYAEAHDIIHNYCQMLRTQKDNYSYRMITMLTTGAQVEARMGNYEEAAKHCQEIKSIADSMHIEKSANLMQKTWDLIQKEEDVDTKNTILNILGILLLMGLTGGFMVVYYTHRIRRRNRFLIQVLNSLEAYRNMANEDIKEPQEEPKKEEEQQPTSDENERLFVKLDGQITRDRLFLNPNFGRDDMARLIGVDKNRIGHIMSRYCDASNASVYINIKRVEYGAKLLLKHPEYTIAAIANECGMTNTVTFNRTFKEVYGMTPSEYRANSEQKSNNQS